MTTTLKTNANLAYHLERHQKLEKLYEKLNYALLGEETEMRYEYKRILKDVIAQMKEEWEIITEIRLQND